MDDTIPTDKQQANPGLILGLQWALANAVLGLWVLAFQVNTMALTRWARCVLLWAHVIYLKNSHPTYISWVPFKDPSENKGWGAEGSKPSEGEGYLQALRRWSVGVSVVKSMLCCSVEFTDLLCFYLLKWNSGGWSLSCHSQQSWWSVFLLCSFFF